MLKRTIFLLLALFWFATVSGGEVSFSTLEKGYYASGIEEKMEEVIRDPRAFFTFYRKIHEGETPPPAVPEVDFGRDMVIAVSPGTKPSGGYDVEIVDINENEGKLTVLIMLKEPGLNEIVTEALTQPYHIILTPKSDAAVEFKWEKR